MPRKAENHTGREDYIPVVAEIGPMPMEKVPGCRLGDSLGRDYCESRSPFMERSISINEGKL